MHQMSLGTSSLADCRTLHSDCLLRASNELRATDFVILQSLQTIRDTRESVRQNFDVVRLEADVIIMQEQNGSRYVP